ncbi:hypothetical protein DB31_6494 [Hyalangium minutum]|uniref:Uncharacterized protein n=1 Tax=Hyalangium minutum TaxID=394096 RepID=A0A085WPA6_9BACT|nr:hypothetical protein DB31_6494 [Hyalangium minutum]
MPLRHNTLTPTQVKASRDDFIGCARRGGPGQGLAARAPAFLIFQYK